MAGKKEKEAGVVPAGLTTEEAAEFERLLGEAGGEVKAEASKDAEAAEPAAPPSTPDPIAEIRAVVERLSKEIVDLRNEIRDVGGAVPEVSDQISELREQLKDLADFRQKAVEVVTQTAEAAAAEAVNGALERTWLPRFEKILTLVKGQKEESAKADSETAELRLHLPLLRRQAGLDGRIARAEAAADRAEKALGLIQQAVGRLQQRPPPPTPAPTGERDPLA